MEKNTGHACRAGRRRRGTSLRLVAPLGPQLSWPACFPGVRALVHHYQPVSSSSPSNPRESWPLRCIPFSFGRGTTKPWGHSLIQLYTQKQADPINSSKTLLSPEYQGNNFITFQRLNCSLWKILEFLRSSSRGGGKKRMTSCKWMFQLRCFLGFPLEFGGMGYFTNFMADSQWVVNTPIHAVNYTSCLLSQKPVLKFLIPYTPFSKVLPPEMAPGQ